MDSDRISDYEEVIKVMQMYSDGCRDGDIPLSGRRSTAML